MWPKVSMCRKNPGQSHRTITILSTLSTSTFELYWIMLPSPIMYQSESTWLSVVYRLNFNINVILHPTKFVIQEHWESSRKENCLWEKTSTEVKFKLKLQFGIFSHSPVGMATPHTVKPCCARNVMIHILVWTDVCAPFRSLPRSVWSEFNATKCHPLRKKMDENC